ncbi:GMP synthase [Rhizobium chutanense]|uniref:GMP synthase n=1 Tax=Rhizobium chutanense TaxID=2035448 RepID=A0A2A6JI73_9HYPH|nr:glutamine amidotransferase [Rhizobium chutanense]PDT05951.1 GMP synthase [Rhizobium chutanense]
MSLSALFLLQTGSPPQSLRTTYGDLPEWFASALGRPADTIRIIRVFDGERLPPPDAGTAAIITGSWSMVTDREPWSEALGDWIREAMALDAPVFGVCYGHQLMADALGGQVDFHPGGREIGSQTISLLADAVEDPLLAGSPRSFTAQLTHLQTVIAPPPGARVLARSEHDAHQILRYGPNAISTQFHPEFTPEIMAGVIRSRIDALHQEGRDPEALLTSVQEAPFPGQLLRDFLASRTI